VPTGRAAKQAPSPNRPLPRSKESRLIPYLNKPTRSICVLARDIITSVALPTSTEWATSSHRSPSAPTFAYPFGGVFWQALRVFVMVAPTIALRKGRRASGPLRYLSRQHGLPWLLFPDTLCPDPLLVVLWAFSGVCCWKPRHEIIHDYLKMIPKFAYISGFVLEYNPFSDINPWKLL